MAVVKGSIQDELVIKRRTPGFRVWRLIWLILLIIATGIGGFVFGYFDSRTQIKMLTEEKRYLTDGLRNSEQTIDDLSQRVAVLQKGGEVDREVADNFRETVRELSENVANLEQEVAFYKGIMAPGSADNGLRISKIEILPLGGRQFNYSVMLTQVVDNTNFIQGEVAVNIIGLRNGEREVLALRDLDAAVTELGIDFRFRYFQEIKGSISVPADFTPQQMQVVLQSRGANSQRVEETKTWNQPGEA